MSSKQPFFWYCRQFRDSVVVDIAGILDVGSFPIILWLLLVGARGERAREALPV